jgi:hypothetical protein
MPIWFRIMGRVRGVATQLGLVLIALALLAAVFDRGAALGLVGFGFLTVGLALSFIPAAPTMPGHDVGVPVRGRWLALNSPGTKIPSHGTHGYGQTFAIDLVFDPADGSRPQFGKGEGFLAPQRFPGFGQPVLAPAQGQAVALRHSGRDHKSRSSWPAYVYFFAEGSVRELFGSRLVLGNYVIIKVDEGVYAALAHLKRDSITLSVGDTVQQGQQIGQCGNSGNTTEPHVHFQLMDSAHPLTAAGLPFLFRDLIATGAPQNEHHFTS